MPCLDEIHHQMRVLSVRGLTNLVKVPLAASAGCSRVWQWALYCFPRSGLEAASHQHQIFKLFGRQATRKLHVHQVEK